MDTDKIVVITQKTGLDGLIERFNTKEQAKFYIEHMGGSFDEYQAAHDKYYESLVRLKRLIPRNQKYQTIDRSFLPNFLFSKTDLIVVLGRDGLVINTAKYLEDQIILALNPDPKRIDGILIPFQVDEFSRELNTIKKGDESIAKITIAKAEVSTKQSLLGVNDLFIGHRSHQSARYTIRFRGSEENHSSSGVIVSTGAGSTGWFKSIVTGAVGIAGKFRSSRLIPPAENEYRFPWDADYLYFSVREPWASKVSGTNIIFGQIHKGERLEIESSMPENGVIFSDGIETDYVDFTSGAIARIGIAEKKAKLVVKKSGE
ncbi:MAG: sugar kinase [Candidatus Odinarchaeota archaeon]